MRLRRRSVAVATVALTAAAMAAPPAVSAASVSGPVNKVIVEAASLPAAIAAVQAAGGEVTGRLDFIQAVVANARPATLASLRSLPGVTVVPDLPVRVASAGFDLTTAAPQLQAIDLGSAWSPGGGANIGVALIDTGVGAEPDLVHHVIGGPNLSGSGSGLDQYGHGTFMAGLISGDGTSSASWGVHYLGVASGAHIVSIKVAGADGSTSLSKVIGGIGWSIAHRKQFNLRVMNLSLSAPYKLPVNVDPLDRAVEAAWASGITVVAAAGNDGPGSVTSPGDDPWVITVGALATYSWPDSSSDTVASFSGESKTIGKPDLLAPGAHTVSTSDPGSTIYAANPSAVIPSDAPTGPYFKGTGTSMSAAIVSGAAALIAAAHPGATPDAIKGALTSSTRTVPGHRGLILDVAAALSAKPVPAWNQHHPISNPAVANQFQGSMPWDMKSFGSSAWAGSSWDGSSWDGSSWDGSSWDGSSWDGSSWDGSSWDGSSWDGSSWDGSSWDGSSWDGSSWDGSSWDGSSWDGSSWDGSSWS